MTEEKKQSKNRKLTGVVVSDRMQKTRVIAVTRLKKHPKYLKYYKETGKFKAHDEKNEYKTGDNVIIEETRPLSKEKRWRIVERVIANNANESK
ncbi:MAG: 30S ribosomal protein S17 [Candidatus Liptonbacteria bacterium]|nr:30S ribosomal protein S17 [Candidatus Liptonbacteria bacterium]